MRLRLKGGGAACASPKMVNEVVPPYLVPSGQTCSGWTSFGVLFSQRLNKVIRFAGDVGKNRPEASDRKRSLAVKDKEQLSVGALYAHTPPLVKTFLFTRKSARNVNFARRRRTPGIPKNHFLRPTPPCELVKHTQLEYSFAFLTLP